MASIQGRLSEYNEILDAEKIDIDRLRKVTFRVGCPDKPWLRSVVWKIDQKANQRHISQGNSIRYKLLLKYLPLVKSEWPSCLARQRAAYRQFVDEVIIQPGTRQFDNNRVDVTMEDHPLNPQPDSKWNQYFSDNEMLVQIDKDCRRLCPGLAFFQSASACPLDILATAAGHFETLRHRVERSVLKSHTVSKNRFGITTANLAVGKTTSYPEEFVSLAEGQEANWEVVERILFVYAKLNPGHGYVQGMNEIIGPIYYSLANDVDPDCQAEVEADTFWCFTNLMSEISDNFSKHLDHDNVFGIGVLMQKFEDTLKYADVTLWLQLQHQEIRPQYYAFRWLTLLLSQEFELPDVLRLWDSLFADKNRFEFLINVCCAMLILVRNDLLIGDFSSNMKLVQSYPNLGIHVILAKAVELAGTR